MTGRQGSAADGCTVDDRHAVDADGLASLLLDLELFVPLLLFGDDSLQGVGHLLELLLVRVVEFVHPLGKRPVYYVVAVRVPGSCLMYLGDDFPQQRKLLILGSGAGGRGHVGFLIFFDRAWEFLFFRGWHGVGHGSLLCHGLAALVVVFHVH